MTDAEIESLALEKLKKAIVEIQKMAPQFIEVLTSNTGQPAIEFSAVSNQGRGGFRSLFVPLEPIKQLALESGVLFDNFVITLTNKETGDVTTKTLSEYVPQYRDEAIKFVTDCVALMLVGWFYPRMAELLEDCFQDHKMMAKGILAEWAVTCFESDEFIHGKTDMRDEIDKAVARVTERKRHFLSDYLDSLPNIVAKRGRGALPKTPFQRERERREYYEKVETTYHNLYVTLGKKPKKTLVAKTLGEGGLSPKTGNDTSLQAFNIKLSRLEINYTEITDRVAQKLNTQS